MTLCSVLQMGRRLRRVDSDVLLADDENRKIDASQEHSGNQGNQRPASAFGVEAQFP